VLLRLAGTVAVCVAAGLGWVLATLPPATIEPDWPPPPPTIVRGAYHMHSRRSDGSGTVEDIATAAARAGLRFVILTDHGDATRPPDPPAYRHGVLCIDAIEISTAGGHVVALNLSSAAPYPLAGETRDVVEDIHRLGGYAIAAHPDSPRPGLRWQAGGAGVDGVEWLNADSEWRRRAPRTLALTAARALFRPAEAVASLFGSGRAGLDAWEIANRTHSAFTIAAVDAHARVGEDQDDGAPPSSLAIAFPGYETMFRTVSQTVRLAQSLSGDAVADASAVIAAITAGHSYSEVRAFVDAPGIFEFSAASGGERVEWGGTLVTTDPVRIHAAVPAGLGVSVVLIRDGGEVTSAGTTLDTTVVEPGAYRVEARLPHRAPPWIVSNAIRIGGAVAPPATGAPAPARTAAPSTPIAPDSWVVEASPTSKSTLTATGDEVRLAYELGPGKPAGQYVALATRATGSTAVERIEFTASSLRPMRLSVQIRLPGGVNGQRWWRSIYVDETPRPISIALADLEPVDRRSPLRPISARVQSILLVIDTVNAKPGTAGTLLVRNAGYVAGRADPPDGR
jgi:hypothetical protein